MKPFGKAFCPKCRKQIQEQSYLALAVSERSNRAIGSILDILKQHVFRAYFSLERNLETDEKEIQLKAWNTALCGYHIGFGSLHRAELYTSLPRLKAIWKHETPFPWVLFTRITGYQSLFPISIEDFCATVSEERFHRLLLFWSLL